MSAGTLLAFAPEWTAVTRTTRLSSSRSFFPLYVFTSLLEKKSLVACSNPARCLGGGQAVALSLEEELSALLAKPYITSTRQQIDEAPLVVPGGRGRLTLNSVQDEDVAGEARGGEAVDVERVDPPAGCSCPRSPVMITEAPPKGSSTAVPCRSRRSTHAS